MLQNEIEVAQRQVKTDAYQMSVGEITSMYKSGELVINPDFQRLFRWAPGQKSKFIESILLGIPLPPIFVFERKDSTWELVDGLQRISTVLEFMGLLKEVDSDALRPPSFLTGTAYLPSLSNTVWEKSELIEDLPFDEQIELDKSHQLAIRRARIGVEILKRTSDTKTKYDLFQRLNAGGTPANSQELRNCIVIMVSNAYFQHLKSLADYPSFRTVLSASQDQIERQRHMEYASRFLVHTFVPYDGKLDVEDYIDRGIITLAEQGEVEGSGWRFRTTFDLLSQAFGENALKRIENGEHQGRVSLAAFECLAVGLSRNLDTITKKAAPVDFIRERIQAFWRAPELSKFFAPGLRGTVRIQRTVPFGEAAFAS
jgi:hypothetical protein